MKIVKLTSENVKRLRVVEIEPDGSLVLIGGRNGAGKTSLLDSIEMALGGEKSIPPQPINTSARRARIVADLGELVIERTFSAKGSELVVRNADGEPQKSPQTLLNSLCSRIAFDPLEFSRLDDTKQARTLRELVGLDFSALDTKRQKLFTDRTAANREAKALETRWNALPFHKDAPAEETSITELMAEAKKRRAECDQNEKKRAAVTEIEREIGEIDSAIGEIDARIADLKLQLAECEERREAKTAAKTKRQDALTAARSALASLVDPDVAEVEARLETVEETNRKVRENAKRAELMNQHREACDKANELTDQIEEIDAEKARQLAAAQFPIPGLGFDEDGVTLNGLPLTQASAAQRLRVSVAMGLALNPKLKVLLIRDGSLLDDDSLRMVAEMAAEHDAQVWIERVGDKDPSAIVIEDGMVREVVPHAGAAE